MDFRLVVLLAVAAACVQGQPISELTEAASRESDEVPMGRSAQQERDSKEISKRASDDMKDLDEDHDDSMKRDASDEVPVPPSTTARPAASAESVESTEAPTVKRAATGASSEQSDEAVMKPKRQGDEDTDEDSDEDSDDSDRKKRRAKDSDEDSDESGDSDDRKKRQGEDTDEDSDESDRKKRRAKDSDEDSDESGDSDDRKKRQVEEPMTAPAAGSDHNTTQSLYLIKTVTYEVGILTGDADNSSLVVATPSPLSEKEVVTIYYDNPSSSTEGTPAA